MFMYWHQLSQCIFVAQTGRTTHYRVIVTQCYFEGVCHTFPTRLWLFKRNVARAVIKVKSPYFMSVAQNSHYLTNKPEADSELILPPSLHQCSVLRVLKDIYQATRKRKKSKQGFEVTPGNRSQDLSHGWPCTNQPCQSLSLLQSSSVKWSFFTSVSVCRPLCPRSPGTRLRSRGKGRKKIEAKRAERCTRRTSLADFCCFTPFFAFPSPTTIEPGPRLGPRRCQFSVERTTRNTPYQLSHAVYWTGV